MNIFGSWQLSTAVEFRTLWLLIGFWSAVLLMKNIDDKQEKWGIVVASVFSALFILQKIYGLQQ
jgi:hypothetical protein